MPSQRLTSRGKRASALIVKSSAYGAGGVVQRHQMPGQDRLPHLLGRTGRGGRGGRRRLAHGRETDRIGRIEAGSWSWSPEVEHRKDQDCAWWRVNPTPMINYNESPFGRGHKFG